MASSKKGWSFFAWVLVASLEILVIMLFVSSDYMRRNTVIETERIEASLGTQAVIVLSQRADALYQKAVVEPDLEGWMRRLYIPTADERARSVGLERLGDDQGVWDWAEGRIQAFLDMLYWIFRRLALFSIWVPVWIPAFVLAVRLGWLERAVKKTNFAYTSPFLLGLARRSMGLCFFTLITVFVTPMALYPDIVPLLFGMVVLLLGFAVGHVQKRI